MSRTIPALLTLVLVCLPLAAEEIPVSDPVIGEAVGSQDSPSIASDGQAYFAVWSDLRAGVSAQVYGSRVDENGTMLDPLGIRLSDFSGATVNTASIVWTGKHYGVFWIEDGTTLKGRRVGRDGVPIDPRPILIASAFYAYDVTVASNGTAFLVRPSTYLPYVFLVSDDLRSVRSISLAAPERTVYNASIASDGDVFMISTLTSTPSYGLEMTRMSGSGEVLSSVRSPYGRRVPNHRQLLWTGSEYVLISLDDSRIFATRFDRDGKEITPRFLAAQAPQWPGNVTAAAASDGTVVIWYETNTGNAFTTAVRQNAVIATPRAIGSTTSSLFFGTRLSTNGRTYVAALAGTTLEFVTLNGQGERSDPSVTGDEARSSSAQTNLASDDQTASILVWEEKRGSQSRIVARNVDARYPFGAAVEVDDSTAKQSVPAVAGNGETHLITWVEETADRKYQTRAALLSADTLLLRSEPVTLNETLYSADQPSVIWDGSVYVVAFTEMERVSYAVIDRSGSVDGAVRKVPLALASPQRSPVMTRIGDVTFLAWQEGQGLTGMIRAMRLGSGGKALDTIPFRVSDVVDSSRPAISSDGLMFVMFTWMRGAEIRARRFASTGQAVDEKSIRVGTGSSSTRPRIGFDGQRFLVAWEGGAVDRFAALFDIRFAYVSRDGSVGPTNILTEGTNFRAPRVLRLRDGAMAIGYEHFELSPLTEGVGRIVYETELHTPPPVLPGRRRAIAH